MDPEVYCVAGVDPEVHAYAMAKYSRSALTMRQALEEISKTKAEEFLDTFYFQYGHRSIADLAHLSFAIENVSMLAAIAIVDESRWDGQERSSRYQDFKKSGYYVPALSESLRNQFVATVENLFAEYESLSDVCFEYLCQKTPKPHEMPQGAYKRTIRARAFDIARYLLPLATKTSVGQIVSARTLENQITRLAADVHPDVRRVGVLLKNSASSPAFDLRLERIRKSIEELQMKHPEMSRVNFGDLLANLPIAPTLVKYADAKRYDEGTRVEMRKVASELLQDIPIEDSETVTLVRPESLEVELAATLVYENSNHPYKQIVGLIAGLEPRIRKEVVALGVKHRGIHDEVSRPYAAGQAFQFDILMDIGGFRDLHRHRRCVQILQPYTSLHGYEMPEQISAVGQSAAFHSLMGECRHLWETIRATDDLAFQCNADYVLPLAFRRRALFKMDFAEVLYICELRTGPGGHFSYRRAAYDMFLEVKRLHPEIASHIRVHDVKEGNNLLER